MIPPLDETMKWKRKWAREEAGKRKAQCIAFELLYPKERNSTVDELKASVFYLREELRKSTLERDVMKVKNEELRANIKLLEIKLKGATR